MFCDRRSRVMIPLAVVILLLSPGAYASPDSVFVDISTGAYILNDDSTDARILLRFDLPERISDAEIFFAELVIPVESHIPDSSALRVLLHPLLISWDPSVTWDEIGDSLSNEIVADIGTHYATSEESTGDAYFNITQIIEAWMEERITNNGVILFCSTDEVPYFRYSRDQDSPFGRVRIYFNH